MSDHAVFIAHAEPDRGFALEIAAELRRAGHSTWTYEENGVAGVSYLEQVHSAIRDCDAVVLLLSSHSLESHHVRREAETAYEHQKVIVPVRIGVDHARVQADSIFRMTSGTAVSIEADGISRHDLALRIGEGLQYATSRSAGHLDAATTVVTSAANRVDRRLPAFVEVPAGVLATYFRELFALVTGPKRFAAHLLTGSAPLQRAALFLAISVTFNFVLRLPFAHDTLAWEIPRTAIFALVVWTAAGTAIWLACRAVGGTGSIERTFAVGFYDFGVLELLMATTGLAFVGAIVLLDPGTYAVLKRAMDERRFLEFFTDLSMFERTSMRVAATLVVAGFVVALAWIVAGWGAFRTAHELTRLRSLAAFVLAALLWIPLGALTLLLAAALALPQGRG